MLLLFAPFLLHPLIYSPSFRISFLLLETFLLMPPLMPPPPPKKPPPHPSVIAPTLGINSLLHSLLLLFLDSLVFLALLSFSLPENVFHLLLFYTYLPLLLLMKLLLSSFSTHSDNLMLTSLTDFSSLLRLYSLSIHYPALLMYSYHFVFCSLHINLYPTLPLFGIVYTIHDLPLLRNTNLHALFLSMVSDT